MKRTMSLIIVMMMAIQIPLNAQIKNYNVFFKNSTFTPIENRGIVPQLELQSATNSNTVYGFLQFYEIPNKAQRHRLTTLGIVLGDYIKNNAYSITVPLDNYAQIRNLEFVRSFFIQTPDLKLRNGINQFTSERANFFVSFYKNSNIKQCTEHLKHEIAGAIITEVGFGIYTINIKREQVFNLAQLPYVIWIEEKNMEAKPLDIPSLSLHRTNILKSQLTGQRGLSGNGVAIGIFDGLVFNHIDFADRLHIVKGSTILDHATEVAGLFAGTGNRNPYAMGNANKADIYSWEIQASVIGDIDSGASTFNMVVANHSYFIGNDMTCTNRGDYDIVSYYFDTLAVMHPSLLQTFASGNHRANNCIAGGYRTVFEGLQSSKNGLTVGSVDAIDGNSTNHSYGPTLDGRIKPDVVDRGVSIYSSATSNNYASASGTSFSSPNAAGAATLLYEHYRNLNSNKDPDSHTIKAILLNTAKDLGNTGPDFIYGFGRIDAYKAAKVIENNQYLIDSVAHQDSCVDTLVTISALSKTKEIKFLLAWAEEPTPLATNFALINDLDIFIIDPNLDTIRPLVPDYTNPAVSATQKIDTLNNNEQVVVSNVVAGDYKVVVLGTTIPSGKIPFSLTWIETEPYLELTYPFGGEKWLPPKDAASAQIIAWDGFDLSGTISLEFSDDSGSTWSTLVSGLPNTTRYYTWNSASPTLTTRQALIRVSTTGGMSSTNNNVFTIKPNPLNTGVSGITCSGQVYLHWNPTVATDTFKIFQLIGEEMTEIAKTTDTSYLVTGLTNGQTYWFAIAIIDKDSIESIRSWAQSFTPSATPIPASVNTQPTDQTGCRFSSISFTPTFNGTPTINYQWQISSDGGVTWNNIPGATSANLTIYNIDSSLMTNTYRNSFYNACGNLGYTNTVSITVDSIPQKPTIAVNPLTVCKDTVEFSYPHGTVSLNYEWIFEEAETDTMIGLDLDNPTAQWVYPTLPGTKTIYLTVTFPNNGCKNADTTTVNIGCIALPIELLNFNALPRENYVLLQWQTASEMNNHLFTVLKTIDLIQWFEIGKVNGAGNSYITLDYEFKDYTPLQGIQYYRLKQTDWNNNDVFSQIATVIFHSQNKQISIYPNPVESQFHINSPNTIQRITIKDFTGKTIQVIEQNRTQVSMQEFATGIYCIEVEDEAGVHRFNLLKQ